MRPVLLVVLPRRAIVSFAFLSVTLAACASVPKTKDRFVVLESSKFT